MRTKSQHISIMLLFRINFVLAIIATIHCVQGFHHTQKCPPTPAGDFTLHNYQLYPENAVWDPEHCLVYFSALFNGSISPLSPTTHRGTPSQFHPPLTFHHLTLTDGHHASGLHYTPATNLLTVVINSPKPFLTAGADVGGDNFLVQYDIKHGGEVWRVNLTETTLGRWGGFVDVGVVDTTTTTTTTRRAAYVVSSYPAGILRVRGGKGGKREVAVWYGPRGETTVEGYTGCAVVGDVMLVAGMGAVWRFDLSKERGEPVRLVGVEGGTNRVKLPEAYGGRVALVSQGLVGVTVLRSRDGSWRSAEELGTIRSGFPRELERIVPSTVQVGPRRQYMVGQYFPGEIVPGTMAGNRSDFPMFDITEEIEGLLT
ncbi:hypothetical protein C8A01DRAFT_15112 [Parachaetomium inaequale]|uniref:Uncharacterized protein n=1 Tax=Parachaetomium inaequale TaxID=2588326 RepID=A0AAN6ST37_9PEZI|nr:hypothetical protein C8A01DRAFT_15112 [Parachaetomium inaequale]